MCVVALSWGVHPHWRLVLVGNRDEFHARPSAPLARWTDHDHLIAGRDIQSGGSWLGVSEQGRLAVVTNLRGFGEPLPDKASRGALVADYLAGDGQYADPSIADLAHFNPFNLITFGVEGMTLLSNRPVAARTPLHPGLYGLSNGVPGEAWPRKTALKSALQDWLESGATKLDALLEISGDERPIGHTEDSPIFIRSQVYGTRCSTVVAVDHAGSATIIERRFAEDGTVTGETRLPFHWTP